MVMFTDSGNRVSGLTGIDTDSMIKQIMRAESMRMHRLQRRRTLVTWQQEAYRSTANSINAFSNEFLSTTSPNSIRIRGNTNPRSATSSSNAIGVRATGTSRPGRHTMEVHSLASRDRHTSTAVNGSIRGSETFDSSNIRAGDSFRLNLDGVQRDITFNQADVDRIRYTNPEAPVGERVPRTQAESDQVAVDIMNEKMDTAFGRTGGTQRVGAELGSGGRLVINTANPGNRLTITEGATKPSSVRSTGNMTAEDWANLGGARHTFEIDGREVTVDFEAFGPDNPLTQDQAISMINRAIRDEGINNVSISADRDGYVTFRATGTNSDINISGDLFNNIMGQPSANLNRTNTLDAALGGVANNANNRLDDNHTLEEIFPEGSFDGNGEMTFTINGQPITLHAHYNRTQMENAINRSGAGVTLSYNTMNGKFTLESNREGELNQIDFGPGPNPFQDMLGLTHVEGTGTDAEFTLNGVRTTRPTNNFTEDGIVFELNEVTEGEVVINVVSDTSSTETLILDFVEEYNRLMRELNDQRTTPRPRTNTGGHFEPLTPEEREAMTADEIRLWEEQAKTGMLHNSDILRDLNNDLRRAMSEPVTLSCGTRVSMADFGITSRRDGTLVVDENQLRSALENFEPEQTAEFLAEIGNRLYDATNTANRRIEQRAGADSGLAAVNNAHQTRINSYDDRIRRMEEQLQRKEMRLIVTFARMEAAVMQSNSQMDFLFAQMGL